MDKARTPSPAYPAASEDGQARGVRQLLSLEEMTKIYVVAGLSSNIKLNFGLD